uniref:ATP synthase F0 subunit 6 n=1 Tax=Inocellia fulvostigmata TaxID=3018577 RepID=UPI0022FD6318|nr:ATP synthase F0 subunit 6 [Inocellia fulvostigmata]WBK02762.1 ATP synthase F0 subunit 6 [Inocellia fulvostigmata]
MMTNLFSVFDPSTTIFNWSLNWFSSILGLIIMPTLFWILPNRLYFIWTNILMKLNQEFKTLLGIKNYKISMIFTSLFLFIMFNNLLGLFPYIFTSSSHMNFTLTLALPLWISFMIYGWINNTNHMFTHLVPQGTPNVLMPFMVCIETISNIIRPGTLAIRLAANMIAGHLLLTLLGNTGSSLASIMISLLLITQILLLMLEFAVSIIQAYVFSVLSTLYSSEV